MRPKPVQEQSESSDESPQVGTEAKVEKCWGWTTQFSHNQAEGPPVHVTEVPTKSLVPAPPAMAPPSLPGRSFSREGVPFRSELSLAWLLFSHSLDVCWIASPEAGD